jgi:phosphotransacetylase
MKQDPLLDRARRSGARLVLAGGDVEALAKAAARLAEAEIPGVSRVGAGGIRPENHPRFESVAMLLRSRQPRRVTDGIHALDLAVEPIRFAAALVALGEADALLAGPGVTATVLAEVAEWTVGGAEDGGSMGSVSWLLLQDDTLVACADCALAGELLPADRARLARAAAAVHAQVSGEAPRVAFLGGSLVGHADDRLEEAVQRLGALAPGVSAQADGGARFRGRANVLIFPGGTAAHLAVRTARALAGVRLLGPLLLGPSGVMAGVIEDAEEAEVIGTAALAMLAAGRSGI